MKWKFIINAAVTIILSGFIMITGFAQPEKKLTDQQALQLATEAYIFGCQHRLINLFLCFGSTGLKKNY